MACLAYMSEGPNPLYTPIVKITQNISSKLLIKYAK